MSLNDLCEKKNQGVNTTVEKVKYSKSGYPVIRAKNIGENKINFEDIVYVDETTFRNIRTDCKPLYGDVLYTNIGSHFGCAAVVKTNVPFVIAWNVLRIQPRKDRIVSDFLCYLLNSKANKLRITSLNSSSTMSFVNGEELGKIEFVVPALLEIQKSIVDILCSFDGKIELNLQMNKTLEKIAQTLFVHWFVDFEFPNEEGKPYKSSGGEMDYNENRKKEIPKSWKVGCIEDVADVIGGGTPSTKVASYFASNGIPWLTPKDLSGYEGKFIERGATDLTEEGLKNSSAKLMPKGTILFTSRAPIGYAAIALNDIATNQGFKSLVPKDNMKSEYLYQFIKKITPYVQNISSGSTFGEVTGSTMKQIKILIPEYTVLEKFENFMNPINSRIINNTLSIRTLTKIRGLLLPKLMSGRIRIPVEKGADQK
jgi:type I restriction enzyme S subunit